MNQKMRTLAGFISALSILTQTNSANANLKVFYDWGHPRHFETSFIYVDRIYKNVNALEKGEPEYDFYFCEPATKEILAPRCEKLNAHPISLLKLESAHHRGRYGMSGAGMTPEELKDLHSEINTWTLIHGLFCQDGSSIANPKSERCARVNVLGTQTGYRGYNTNYELTTSHWKTGNIMANLRDSLLELFDRYDLCD